MKSEVNCCCIVKKNIEIRSQLHRRKLFSRRSQSQYICRHGRCRTRESKTLLGFVPALHYRECGRCSCSCPSRLSQTTVHYEQTEGRGQSFRVDAVRTFLPWSYGAL